MEIKSAKRETEYLECSFCRWGTLCRFHRRHPARRCGSENQSGVELACPQFLVEKKTLVFFGQLEHSIINQYANVDYRCPSRSPPSLSHSTKVRWAKQTKTLAAAEGTIWHSCLLSYIQGEHTRLKDTWTPEWDRPHLSDWMIKQSFVAADRTVKRKAPTVKFDAPRQGESIGCQIEITQVLWQNAIVFLGAKRHGPKKKCITYIVDSTRFISQHLYLLPRQQIPFLCRLPLDKSHVNHTRHVL